MNSFGKRAMGARLERMQASTLWNGLGFRNVHPPLPGLRDATVPRPTLKEFLSSGGRRAPTGPLPSQDPREAWSRPVQSGLRATWLGHSTVLIEIDGHRVLTDPVWGTRASPFRLLGPKRFQPVPLRLRQMPEVDVVVRGEGETTAVELMDAWKVDGDLTKVRDPLKGYWEGKGTWEECLRIGHVSKKGALNGLGGMAG